MHENIFNDFEILENLPGKDETFLYNVSLLFFNLINLSNAYGIEMLKTTVINCWIKLIEFESITAISEEKTFLVNYYVKYHMKYPSLFEFNFGNFYFFLSEKRYLLDKLKDDGNTNINNGITKLKKLFYDEKNCCHFYMS